MTGDRTRSANDFRIAFRRIQGDYERLYEAELTKTRKALADPQRKDPDLEAALEAHSRTFLIDRVLEALRWQIITRTPSAIERMIPEAQIDSVSGVRRYLDYLGFEREVRQPLLVVEAKRPTDFPITPGGSTEAASEMVTKWVRKPKTAPGDWKEWILSLKDYVVSVFDRTKLFPVRAAITDGKWIVIFESPEDTFGPTGERESRYIHVFVDSSDVDARYDLVFRLLDQRQVSRNVKEVGPGAIVGLVAPERLVSLFHGLRLKYATYEDVGERMIPTISVMPTILLRAESGSWIRVASESEIYRVPYEYDLLGSHLGEVRESAKALLRHVQHQLQREMTPSPLEVLYADEPGFDGMPGVEEVPGSPDHFRIVTGDVTHFILAEPTFHQCLFHDFAKTVAEHCQIGVFPILNRTVERPRVYFTNTQAHHCCHSRVDDAKHVQLTEENASRVGPRSGRMGGDVFCEIAPIEEFLCCRACCFQTVCMSSKVLRLPCSNGEVPA